MGLKKTFALLAVVFAVGCSEPHAPVKDKKFGDVITPSGGGGLSSVTAATGAPFTGAGTAGSPLAFAPTLSAEIAGTGSAGAPLKFTTGTSNGQLLAWNGTAWALNGYYGDPAQRAGWVDEFDNSATSCATVGSHFIGVGTGTGVTCSTSSLSGHPGMLGLGTGSTAVGGCRYDTSNNAYAFGGSIGPICTTILMREATLSNSTDEYIFKAGFGVWAALGADPTDGVFAVYDRAANGDFWVFRTCASSSCTSLKLDGTAGTVSQPITGGLWNKIKNCVSADGTSATMTVNDVLSGTITTTIPLESGARRVGIGATMAKTVGTAGRIADIDYQSLDLPFGAAR